MKKPAPQVDMSKEQLILAQQWLDEAPTSVIPLDVKVCLSMLLENMLKGEHSAKGAAKGFHELLVKFGFKPSSEKNKSPPSAKDAPSQVVVDALAQKSKTAIILHDSAKRELDEIVRAEMFIECVERDGEQVAILEELEQIEDEVTRDAAQNSDLAERLALGGDADPALEPALETLFPPGPIHATASTLHFPLNRKELEESFGKAWKSVQKETVKTKRFDFSLQMHCFDVTYETARDPSNGRSMSAAPQTLGPKGFQITLRAIVNLVLLTVAFLIPMHRVSRMLGNATIFHRSNIARYLGLVSEKALPIYFQLVRELANAKFLWADATPTRVNDVNAAIEKRTRWVEGDFVGPPVPFPWEIACVLSDEDPLEAELPSPKIPLWRRLQDELGFAFEEKSKTRTRSKTRHQTMVVHGRTDLEDARSHTVIFRSCLGDVGNVLDKMLEQRIRSKKELYLQCDHSSANRPSNPEVLKHISLTMAGCLAHARRPFKKHRNQDPERCDEIMSMMFYVTHVENLLQKQGKNRENTLSVRRSWSAHTLEVIQFALQRYSQLPTWSALTPLGKAARHFIKHFEKLTVYLKHPELDATNNVSERLLRPEKLSQGSSYFRDSLEGRARFDILRSLHQTCVSAGLPLAHYLLHILQTPSLEIERHPEHFTPLAVKKLLASEPKLTTRIERILTQGY